MFDPPLDPRTAELAGGNLTIEEAQRRGRDAADDHIVSIVDDRTATDPHEQITVATSDAGLRARLPDHVTVIGVGRFRELIGY